MLTERQRICLEFLNDGRMEALPIEIGYAILKRSSKRGGSNVISIASNVLGALKRCGFVMRLSDLNAWRITTKGRAALAE